MRPIFDYSNHKYSLFESSSIVQLLHGFQGKFANYKAFAVDLKNYPSYLLLESNSAIIGKMVQRLTIMFTRLLLLSSS